MSKTPFKKPLCFLLSLLMILGLYPFSVITAEAAEITPFSAMGETKTADPSTMNDWVKYFNSSTTEYAGGVWTDKSVFTDASAFAANGISLTKEDDFLIALSAMASNITVAGMQYTPTDTMLLLDVSGSMDDNGLSDEMAAAANASIKKLLDAGKYNRVGVALYSGSSGDNSNSNASVIILPLGRYTSASGNYIVHSSRNGKNISVGSDVKDENGRSVSGSKKVVGATYIQKGVLSAVEQFSAQAGNTTVTDPALGTLKRLPVIVLMSDGAPTLGSTNFTSPGQYDLGNGSNGNLSYLGFVTQLSLASTVTSSARNSAQTHSPSTSTNRIPNGLKAESLSKPFQMTAPATLHSRPLISHQPATTTTSSRSSTADRRSTE